MTPKPPNSLIRHVREGRCIVFVGAGLSAGAGLPTWKKLLLDVIEEMSRELPGGDRDVDELRRLVDQGKLLEVAEHCKERLGGGFHTLLTDKLRADTAQLPETFRLLMRIPFAAWVTTNYDKLLERAYAEERRGSPRVLTHMDTESLGRLLFDGGQFVLKAHGDIDRHGTVVLTSRDYADIIHANPSFNAVFSSLLLTRALLFVGYSLSDPDFRLLMDRQFTAFKGFVPDRYALMGGLGQVEQDVLWRTARIRVLPYPDGQHGEVLNFLRLLHDAMPPEAQSAAPAPAAVGRPASPSSPTPQVAASMPAPGAPRSPSFLDSTLGASDDSASPSAEVAPGAVPPFRAAHAVAGGGPVLESFYAPESAGPKSELGSSQGFELSIQPSGDALKMELSRSASPMILEERIPLVRFQERIQHLASSLDSDDALKVRDALDDLLNECLPREFRQFLEKEASESSLVTLHLAPGVEWIPWEMATVGGRPLVLRCPMVRAPVGTTDSARGRPRVGSPARILLIAPSTAHPSMASREIQQLIGLYREATPLVQCTLLADETATPDRVLSELLQQPYDLVHYVGDVGFDSKEPFLYMHEDEPLLASALRPALVRNPPAFLILNSFYSAFIPAGFPAPSQGMPSSKEELPSYRPKLWGGRPGFLQLATETGVGAFVGLCSIPLEGGAEAFSLRLHKGLLQGEVVSQATFRARHEARKRFPTHPTPLQYVLSGYGDLKLR